MPRTIFETCHPRKDVQSGVTKDEQFAADLAQVVNCNGIQAVSSLEELRRLLDETSEPAQLGDEFEIIRRIV